MDIKQEVVTVADNDRFTGSIEFLNGDPFLHIEVHEWSKQAMQEMQVLFDMVVQKCEEENIEVMSFYGSKDSVRVARNFAEPDHLEQVGDNQYVGCWYI